MSSDGVNLPGPIAFRAESLLGASLAGQKKYTEAEPLLLVGYQGMAARKDGIAVPDWYHLDLAREWIVQFYEVWGKPAKAVSVGFVCVPARRLPVR